MGRPREFDEQALLDAATELFWSNGYDATSIEDVSAATGVGNGSIYAAYKNKLGLFLTLFERYCDQRAVFVEQVVDASGGSAHDAAHAFFEAVIADCISQPDRRGCLMVTSVAVLGQRVPEVTTLSKQATDRMEKRLSQRLAADGPQTPHEVATLSAHLVLVSQGLIQLSRQGVSRTRLRELAAVAIGALPARTAAWSALSPLPAGPR